MKRLDTIATIALTVLCAAGVLVTGVALFDVSTEARRIQLSAADAPRIFGMPASVYYSRANSFALTLSLLVGAGIVLYRLHAGGTPSRQQRIPAGPDDVADSSTPQPWLYGSTSLLCLQTGAVILVDGTALVHRAAATDKTIGAYPDRRAAEAALGILAERLNAIASHGRRGDHRP